MSAAALAEDSTNMTFRAQRLRASMPTAPDVGAPMNPVGGLDRAYDLIWRPGGNAGLAAGQDRREVRRRRADRRAGHEGGRRRRGALVLAGCRGGGDERSGQQQTGDQLESGCA